MRRLYPRGKGCQAGRVRLLIPRQSTPRPDAEDSTAVVTDPDRSEADSKSDRQPTHPQTGDDAAGPRVDAVDRLGVEIRHPERAKAKRETDGSGKGTFDLTGLPGRARVDSSDVVATVGPRCPDSIFAGREETARRRCGDMDRRGNC